MFKRTSVGSLLGAVAFSLFLIAPADAAVRTTSVNSGSLTVGSSPVSYGDLTIQCVAANEIASGFKLSVSNQIPGLSFVGQATFTFTGSWSGGDASTRAVTVNADGFAFEPTSLPTCGEGGLLTVSGLSLRYTGSPTTEQPHLLVQPKTASTGVIVSRSLVLAGTTQTVVAGPRVVGIKMYDMVPAAGDGSVDRIIVTFNTPLSTTTAQLLSDWTLNAGTWTGLRLNRVVGVSGSDVTLEVDGYEGTGNSATSHGIEPTLTLRSGSSVRSAQGVSASGFTDAAIQDLAVPRVKSAVLSDVNLNGSYDQVEITFTENVGIGTLTLSQALVIFRVMEVQSGNYLSITNFSDNFGARALIRFAESASVGNSGTGLKFVISPNSVLKDSAGNGVVAGTISANSTDRYPVLIGLPLVVTTPAPVTTTPPVTEQPKQQTPEPTPQTPADISYPSVRINNQANYTKTQSVTLDLYAGNATQMQIANSSNLSSATWIDYSSSKTWTLTSGKGTKTVCVRFRNSVKTSTTECDTILFDSAAKEPSSMSVVIDKGNDFTTSTLVTLAIKASNAAEMRISNNSSMEGSNWIPYKTAVAWNIVGGSGQRSVYVQFRSSSLIESSYVSDVITIGYPNSVYPILNVAGLSAGDLIKLPDDGNKETTHDQTVYYFGSDGKRHAFPMFKVYDSWFVNFYNVKVVSMDTMSQIPLGMSMLVRPGTYLVKSPSIPRVYVVTPGGVLRPLKSEAAAVKHFGKNWASRVVDLPDAFFSAYTVNSSEYGEFSVVPDGVVVEANGVRWYVESGDLYPFGSNGFADNGFQDKFVVKVDKKPSYSTKSTINGRLDKYSKFYYRDSKGSLIGV